MQNGNIALSCNNPSLSVVIIDSCTYETIKTIKPSNKIPSSGSLCLFDEASFIYFCGDSLIQISSDNYSILHTSYNETSCGGIIPIQDGKHFAIVSMKFQLLKLKLHNKFSYYYLVCLKMIELNVLYI